MTCFAPPHAAGPVSVEFSPEDANYTHNGCIFTYIDNTPTHIKLQVTEMAEVYNPCVIENCKPLQSVWYEENDDDKGSF